MPQKGRPDVLVQLCVCARKEGMFGLANGGWSWEEGEVRVVWGMQIEVAEMSVTWSGRDGFCTDRRVVQGLEGGLHPASFSCTSSNGVYSSSFTRCVAAVAALLALLAAASTVSPALA